MTEINGKWFKNCPISPVPYNYNSCKLMTTNYDENWDIQNDGKFSPSLIPNFETPVSKWATSIIRILNSAGVRNFDATNVGLQIIPILLNKLPRDISEIVPINSLEKMMDFLLNYDKEKPSWTNFTAVSSKNLRPTLAYLRAQFDMQSAWPGLDNSTYRKLSWDLVRNALPDTLRFNLSIAKIEIPTDEELFHIDNLWFSVRGKESGDFKNPNIDTINVNNINTESSVMDKLNILIQKIDGLMTLLHANVFSPAKNFRSAGFYVDKDSRKFSDYQKVAPTTLKNESVNYPRKYPNSVNKTYIKKNDSSPFHGSGCLYSSKSKNYNKNYSCMFDKQKGKLIITSIFNLPYIDICICVDGRSETVSVLIDSGSVKSILPRRYAKFVTSRSTNKLIAVNQTVIKVYGTLKAKV